MIDLRHYQGDTISSVRKEMKTHKHILVESPTGSGKTVMFSYIAQSAINRKTRVCILSNRTELLTQTGGTLEHFGVSAEYISPEHKEVPTGRCIVAMAQTFNRRMQSPEWLEWLRSVDLFIIDEVHIQDYNYLFESHELDDKYVLGFTATPIRTGKQRQLGLDFSVLVNGVAVEELISLGFLMPADHYTLDAPDLSKVGYDAKAGDYKQKQMAEMFNNPKRYEGVIDNYLKYTPNTKAVAFCCSQAHAIQTCIAFNEAGIKAKFLVSGLKKTDEFYDLYLKNKHLTGRRKDIVKEFKRGDFDILCNAAILTTGFDEPSIETVIVNRATHSLALWLQMIGRGSRVFKGKTKFNILDFGNNVARHGTYEQPRGWGLWHETKEGGGVAMSKECPELEKDSEGNFGCGMIVHIGFPKCPFCGYIFSTPEELRIVELKKIVGGNFKFKEMSPAQLLAYAELKGYKKPWVYIMLYEGADDRSAFVKGMKEIGYSNYKFIYETYRRIHDSKK